MTEPAKALLIGGLVTGYVGFLVTIIIVVTRWSRRNLDRRAQALLKGLEGGGARQLGAPKVGGHYVGTEVDYEVAGHRVTANTYYVNRKWVRANLLVRAGPFPAVVVYPEGKVERFGKKVGINHEVQTGDPAFDALAYVDTNETNDALVARLLAPPSVRAATAELLKLGYQVQFSSKGVEAFQLVRGGRPIDGSGSAKAAATLGRIADHVPSFTGETFAPNPRLRHILAAIVLTAAFLGGVGFAGGTAHITDRTLDGSSVAFAFLICGGLLWMVFVLALAAVLRGRSDAMRNLLASAGLALIGIPAFSGSLLLCLNQWLDESPRVEQPSVVIQLRKHKSDYSVVVDGWRPGDKTEVISTRLAAWKRLKSGDAIVLKLRKGALGWQWVEEL